MNDMASGVITFQRYEVESVNFQINDEYKEEEVAIDIAGEAEISDSGNDMLVKLKLDIFRDAVKNKYPFEMSLVLKGFFTLNMDEEGSIKEYQANALAILYPYARALVSSYTANANVTPLILPTINISKLLETNIRRN